MSDTEQSGLSQADRQSPAWRRLTRHMEARIQQLRVKNDASLDPMETAAVRGQIKELKYLLAWGTNPATVANEDSAD